MVRSKKEYCPVMVEKSIKDRLERDKKNFQNNIGGGTWSINDTIKEYIKILDGIAKDVK